MYVLMTTLLIKNAGYNADIEMYLTIIGIEPARPAHVLLNIHIAFVYT